MAGNQVRIGVGTTGVKGVESDLHRLRDSFDKFQKQGVKGFSIGVGAAATVKAFSLLDSAISASIAVIGQANEAALEEEESISKLGAALRANVPDWDGNTAAIEKTLQARMKLGFSDDEQRQSLALLVVATNDVTKALELERGAMDLARLKGISLADASAALIKIEAGQFRGLKALGIELKAGATQTEALAAVEKAAAGQAEAFAATNRGKLLVSQVKVDESLEKLGAITMPIFVAAVETAADSVENIAGLLDLFDKNARKVDGSANQAAGAFGALAKGWEGVEHTFGLAGLRTWAESLHKTVVVAVDRSLDAIESKRSVWHGTTSKFAETLPLDMEEARKHAVKVAQKTPGDIADALRRGRGKWQQALDDLTSDVDVKMSKAAEVAKLKGILAGKQLAIGLASGDPIVRAAAASLERAATERLAVLRGTASKIGDRAAKDLAAAIKRGRPHTAAAAQLHEIAVKNALGTLPSSAYGWGVALGRNYASGIKSTVTVVKLSAQALAQAAARNLRLRSPAEEGPLSGVGPEGWGKKLASDFAKGMRSGQGGIGSAGAGLAGAAAFTGQGVAGAAGGMALAGAGAGINITINFPGMIVAPTQAQAAEIGRLVGPAVADHLRSRGFIPR